MKTLGIALMLGLAGTAGAAPLTCTAKVTIHKFEVTVEAPGGPTVMTVKTDTGAVYSGFANYSHSPKAGSANYYIHLDHQSGLLLEVEDGGLLRKALCLGPTECYLCR